MELLLLIIYATIVWLIFFKFKWLPWNIVSQVIVITIPVIGLTILILTLNSSRLRRATCASSITWYRSCRASPDE